MQVSAVISFLAVAVMTVRADSFSAEDQAIWIDRYNYFRTTGLPWSAGDMRRIGWSSDLATSAASTASKCSATSAAGVNVYQSSSANSSSIIDEAIQQWVVETSMSTLKTLAQPGASGVDVGTGTYNSYSQVLWAATTSVGCATASCSGGEMVVCEYSPAGNDGSSPWYVHADTASDCPSGTTASQGLCIVEGDAANNQIAPIPAGKLTYEVYPSYVADIQTVLIEAARALANGSGTSSTEQTASNSTEQTATTPTATTAAPNTPSSATQDTSAATKTSSSNEDSGAATKTSSSTEDSAATKTSSSTDDSAATKTDSSKKTTTASSSTDSSSSSDSSTTATKTGKTSETPATSSSSSSSESSSTATKTGKTTQTTEDSSTKQTTASNSDESAPGTVKASSDTGSTFTNQATSKTTESSTEQTSTSAPVANTPTTANTESTTGSGGASSINNQSATTGGGGISAVGMAGMIVLAIVAVAAFGVVMSYKRNQKRQREIMRDGGIRII
ncbi:hypothetical protein F441_16563 [Phytophthora nicotianae CJ01A1]|uniref:SCP domain-containing protein n=3 Tax=Phytophthora nicotianae TaxID=4792 RepID=V9EE74_PHYNI|nr:hypothetical protein F443_16730 [Phytophthora nicotianae P1569]ETK77484.1 hypothetical protein L915_16264 [Phytophthora nicotianae]ETL30933.1 hypothetical protein L916_16158 [Phytophthora nicotianae]ETM37375.1 hypothetical protein L914_16076 [Phytophthora nicotianae]ETP07109.1 hypothetical protein F441_16563 [Phytophthora nicotianae CJ01A1]